MRFFHASTSKVADGYITKLSSWGIVPELGMKKIPELTMN